VEFTADEHVLQFDKYEAAKELHLSKHKRYYKMLEGNSTAQNPLEKKNDFTSNPNRMIDGVDLSKAPLFLRHSLLLMEICELADKSSGRGLRKLPFQAHAFHCSGTCGIEEYLQAFKKTVIHIKEQNKALTQKFTNSY